MQYKFIKRRSSILAVVLVGAMAVFIARLFWLQIIQHEHYVEAARVEQQRTFVLPATRGEIFMMDGTNHPVKVVLNEAIYTLFADPSTISDKEIPDIIANVKHVAGGEARDGLEGLLKKEGSRYEVLARGLTRSQAQTLKQKKFSGIGFQQESRRSYPEGSLASQTLGFVNNEGKGQYGIEQALNDRLEGRDGELKTVTDVRNVPLTVGKDDVNIPAKNGENIALSLDRNIQSYSEDALKHGMQKAGATRGSVLVMDPNNGNVLAMANLPTYNPAQYYKVKDAQSFVNATVSVPYEPASVIKTFMLSTGIDKGVITPQSTYENTDKIQVADITVHNAALGHLGTLTMQQVLNWSLNTGTVTVAKRLGQNGIDQQARNTMYEYYHDKFGLGEKTNIELPEVDGYIYPPNTVQGNAVRYSNMTFGQGLDVTMIQVASAFSSVVNGGELYQPSVVAGTVDRYGDLSRHMPTPLRKTISKQTSSQMRGMLKTARGSFFGGDDDRKGFQIGGKTGTSESLVNGKYTKNETIATYLGYGGGKTPQYVIMVQVSAPGRGINLEGGIHASPIFTDISNWLLDYLKVQPNK